MRTLPSLEKQLAQLRARHTEQFKAEKWTEMQRTGEKIIHLLDCIVARFPHWKEK